MDKNKFGRIFKIIVIPLIFITAITVNALTNDHTYKEDPHFHNRYRRRYRGPKPDD